MKKILIISILLLTVSYNCYAVDKIKSVSKQPLKYDISVLSTFIKNSDSIVIGTINSQDDLIEGSKIYRLNIENVYKNKINKKTINIYGDDRYKTGNKYLLFLKLHDSELYSEPIYSIYGGVLGMIDLSKFSLETNIQNVNILVKNFNSHDQVRFLSLVKTSASNQTINSNKSKVVDSINQIEKLIEASNNILLLKPIKSKPVNKYINKYSVEIIDEFKGSINQDTMLLLPSYLEIGIEYIVFCKNDSHILTTRNNSIISRNDKQYDSVFSALKDYFKLIIPYDIKKMSVQQGEKITNIEDYDTIHNIVSILRSIEIKEVSLLPEEQPGGGNYVFKYKSNDTDYTIVLFGNLLFTWDDMKKETWYKVKNPYEILDKLKLIMNK